MKEINNNTNENDYNFPKYNTEEIKEAFDCFDINKNGYIGVAELKEIFSIINEEVSDEELDEMINLADKEGDGQVNWVNFYEFITGNGINEEIKLLANNNAFKDLEEGDGDDFEKKELKIIGEKPGKVPIMELTDKTKVDTSKKPITEKNINELNYLDDKIPKKKEDENEYKFLSNKDNDKVVIKLNKNKNSNNDKNRNKINITRNFINMGENEEYDPNDENFIAQVVRRHQKNNAEKINIVDIEDRSPKPKPLLLKKPSIPKTPEPSDDEDNIVDVTKDKIRRTNDILNKNLNPRNSMKTDMLGNNDATIDKHEPYLQMNETNSVFRENIKHDTKKESNKSSNFKKETNSLNTSKIPQVSSGGKESNNVSSQSIVFKNSKGFNDNNSINITDKIVPLNKSSFIKVTKSSAGSGDNIKNEIEKDDKLSKESKKESIKSKKESISSDINHNESKSKSKPSLISFENNTNHLDKSGSEGTNIKLNSKVDSDHSINKNSDLEIVKEIQIKPKNESKSQIETKEENKNSLLKLPKILNQIPISSTQKESSIKDNNNQSNSIISSENLSNLEKNINEKELSSSPSIKEVPIVENQKDKSSFPSTPPKSQRDNVPQDLITHIVKESSHSHRSQSNHSIKIADHLSENKPIELNSLNISEKSGNIQRKKPLQIDKRTKKDEKNKIKDSIILATSHKLKKIEKEKDDLNVIHISKSKEMVNSFLYKPKSKKETIKALNEKEQITPVIIKKFYKKFENILTANLTYEEMINKFQIFNSQEAKEFFEAFTSINSSIEKTIMVGDILILLLNGTNLHSEEKFKFEFLIFDSEKSNFLSKSELCHLLELNFMTNSTLEIEKRINLIIEETKKMNLFDTEVFDFDVLFEILKNKPNLFFPY